MQAYLDFVFRTFLDQVMDDPKDKMLDFVKCVQAPQPTPVWHYVLQAGVALCLGHID